VALLMQPSQECQNNSYAVEPPFVGSNETVLNVDLVLRSVGVDDPLADVGSDFRCGSSNNYYCCRPN
jgi:hypothetical protein